MKIIVGCEESQTVTVALRLMGHEAFSCDLYPSSGLLPQFHFQQDLIEHLKNHEYEAGLFFPPCTYLSRAQSRYFNNVKLRSGVPTGYDRAVLRENAINFVDTLYNSRDKVIIENPIGFLSTMWKKPTQIIQPYEHGHGETKATCLWIKGFDNSIKPSNIVSGRIQKLANLGETKDRAKLRSKTYPGVAFAIANQLFNK